MSTEILEFTDQYGSPISKDEWFARPELHKLKTIVVSESSPAQAQPEILNSSSQAGSLVAVRAYEHQLALKLAGRITLKQNPLLMAGKGTFDRYQPELTPKELDQAKRLGKHMSRSSKK
jgi:hypothetical protein